MSGAGPAPPSRAPPFAFVGFPFYFDARALSTNMYVIEAMDLDHEVTPSSTVHTYHLMAANGYGMQVGAAIVASFHWGIGPAGLVTYPAADNTFLSGRGTGTLVINGLPTTVNATGLGSGTFTLGPDVFGPSLDQSAPQTLHLVPGVYEFGSEGLPAPGWFAWAAEQYRRRSVRLRPSPPLRLRVRPGPGRRLRPAHLHRGERRAELERQRGHLRRYRPGVRPRLRCPCHRDNDIHRCDDRSSPGDSDARCFHEVCQLRRGLSYR